MRLNTRSKIRSFALKSLSGAVASAVLFSASAYAAGLGKLTVLSSLGQPLNAEIELTSVTAEEASGLVAKLAPAEAFRQANIDYNPALSSLRFAVEQRGSRQYVKITSTQPVNEPFVDMLLELSWNSGRLVREYTFLLDPAEMRATQAPQVAPPVVPRGVASSSTNTAPAQPAQPAQPRPSASQPAPAPSSSTAAGGEATEYRVRSGDTLGKIAAQIKPVEVSLDMMLVALYRANPDAFVGNNMNRLKSGQILTVPDTGTIKGTGQGEARGVVVAHAADFNAYRNKLAGQVATAAPDRAPEAAQSSGGKITAKVEERRTAANDAQDKLKLSKADAGKAGTISTEERIAKEKALADATARVKELERNVSDLEKLMSVKNKAAAEAAAKPVAKPVAPPVVATPAPVAAKPVTPPVVATPAPVAATPPGVVTPPAATAPVVTPPVAAEPAPAPKPPKKAAEVRPEQAGDPSIVDTIMDNLIWIGLGLTALGAAIAVMAGLKKRRREDFSSGNEPSILGAPTDQAHSLFAETGGQSVDTSNSVFNSSFAPSASQLDTNEVDPVAEADVYIAYGRDAQAEEILKEALRTHPERYTVRLKLLEIYAARKDVRSFETQAGELYSLTKGQGDEWAQAAALGMAVDPQNPLYASAAAAGPSTIIPAGQDSGERVSLDKPMDDAPTEMVAMDDAPLLPDADTTAVPSPAPAAANKTDDLDFDLGGLSFAPAAAAPVAASNDVPDMDFSLPSAAPAAPAAAKADDAFNMDFNMDFDKPAAVAPAVAALAVDTGEDVHSTDFSAEFASAGKDDLSGMGDLANAFNLPASAPAAPAPTLDLDAMNFDLPSSAPKAAPAPSFDMASIDLDLPGSDASTGLDAVGSSASHTEMETKLDLAIAYQEIGDKEGARELLDEVIKGGSGEQVSKANEMRAKLA